MIDTKTGGEPNNRHSNRFSRCPVTQHRCYTFENPLAIVAAKDAFARAFRMGHEASHIASFVGDTGDVQEGAVWIGRVGEVALNVAILPQNPAVCF